MASPSPSLGNGSPAEDSLLHRIEEPASHRLLPRGRTEAFLMITSSIFLRLTGFSLIFFFLKFNSVYFSLLLNINPFFGSQVRLRIFHSRWVSQTLCLD